MMLIEANENPDNHGLNTESGKCAADRREIGL
jgi:hypothetical protein